MMGPFDSQTYKKIDHNINLNSEFYVESKNSVIPHSLKNRMISAKNKDVLGSLWYVKKYMFRTS